MQVEKKIERFLCVIERFLCVIVILFCVYIVIGVINFNIKQNEKQSKRQGIIVFELGPVIIREVK